MKPQTHTKRGAELVPAESRRLSLPIVHELIAKTATCRIHKVYSDIAAKILDNVNNVK